MKKYRVIAALAACLLVQAASAEVVLYSYKGDIRRCEIPVSAIRRHLEEQPFYEIQRDTCPYISDCGRRSARPKPANHRTSYRIRTQRCADIEPLNLPFKVQAAFETDKKQPALPFHQQNQLLNGTRYEDYPHHCRAARLA